jgi:hypothetical protein
MKSAVRVLNSAQCFVAMWLLALATSLLGCHGSSRGTGGGSGGAAGASPGGADGGGTAAPGDADGGGGTAAPGGADGGGGTACGAVPPSGRHIVASSAPLVLEGMTGDGNYVLYIDKKEQLIYAAPIAGGTPVLLGPAKDTVVFPRQTGALLTPYGGTTGRLSAWTEAGGTHPIATNAWSFDSEMTDDGSLVAYFSMIGKTGTITVSNADGTKQTTVANIGSCGASMQFVRSNLLASYCVGNSSDSFGEFFFATFTGPSFAPTIIPAAPPNLGKDTRFRSVDSAGQYVIGRNSQALSLYSIAGGSPIDVDTKGMLMFARFLENGDVLYTTTEGDIVRYTPASGDKTILVSSSSGYLFDTLEDHSPDLKWIFVSDGTNMVTGVGHLYLTSLAAPGPMTDLQPNVVPAGFTTDSLFALFHTAATQVPFASTLYAAPVSGGTPVKVEATAGDMSPLTGSKILTNTNLTDYDFQTSIGQADLEVIDLKRPTEKIIIVSQAGLKPQVTPMGNIVYAWSCDPGPNAGIWVTPSP